MNLAPSTEHRAVALFINYEECKYATVIKE